MKRRVVALTARACRRGGGKEKARSGFLARGVASAGRGGRCCTSFAPVAQLEERRCREWEVASSNLAGGAFFFKWVPECVNTQEPATEARLRGNDCTDKGNSDYTLRMGSTQGACCEYVEPREANSSAVFVG